MEKKSGYNQHKNIYTQKYQKENLEQINIRVRKGEKQQYIDAAERAGMSLAQFIQTAMKEKIEREEISNE